jgi:Ran GTPase-activating protein (RanGAP) involved in mRNA processing and transport
MTKLDISANSLWAEGGRALAVGLNGNQVMTELNIAGNMLTANASGTAYDDMSGVAAVANTISGMGAMTSLNLAWNMIGSEGAKHVAEAIKVSVADGTISMPI